MAGNFDCQNPGMQLAGPVALAGWSVFKDALEAHVHTPASPFCRAVLPLFTRDQK